MKVSKLSNIFAAVLFIVAVLVSSWLFTTTDYDKTTLAALFLCSGIQSFLITQYCYKFTNAIKYLEQKVKNDKLP